MNTLAIAIGATSLSLVLLFVWMLSLSMRKKRMDQERVERELAYRRTMEAARKQEHQDRLMKAESGHIPTLLFLAKEAERNDITQAFHWYHKAAQLDNITGMYGIVRLSDCKREDMVLREQANYWRLCIAGIEGDLNAKFQAAKALIYGQGVERNIPKGIAAAQEVAEEGNLEAMLFVGDWSVSPDNPTPSPRQSTLWFEKAAQKNSEEGMTKLGLNHLNGVGVEQDLAQGCYWLERAGEKGNVIAMYHAGEAWRDIAPNGNAIAYIWLFLAAKFGHEPAIAARDAVGSTIGVDSVVGLQSLAKPIISKISQGAVVKHSLIRALNKLYKRDEFFPNQTSPHGESEGVPADVSNDTSETQIDSQPTISTETFQYQSFSETTMDGTKIP